MACLIAFCLSGDRPQCAEFCDPPPSGRAISGGLEHGGLAYGQMDLAARTWASCAPPTTVMPCSPRLHGRDVQGRAGQVLAYRARTSLHAQLATGGAMLGSLWFRTRLPARRALVALIPCRGISYYEVLGVPIDATSEEIKQAFRVVSRALHVTPWEEGSRLGKWGGLAGDRVVGNTCGRPGRGVSSLSSHHVPTPCYW